MKASKCSLGNICQSVSSKTSVGFKERRQRVSMALFLWNSFSCKNAIWLCSDHKCQERTLENLVLSCFAKKFLSVFHPEAGKRRNIINDLFYNKSPNSLHYVYKPLYPFICQWTFRLLLCLGYCEYCCCEHRDACMFLNYGFLGKYAQKWNCRIIW